MRTSRTLTSAAFILLAWTLLGPADLGAQDAQDAVPAATGPVMKLGLGLEYFSRTLSWDDGLRSSPMTAAFGVARLEVELRKGFTLGACLGYGLSNFNGLVFRNLPFSLDYEAGTSGSFLAGIDGEADPFKIGDFEIGVLGRYVISLGGTKTLAISGLNASGTADARALWMRVQAGPVVRYMGYQDFTPYLALMYDRLWGTFTTTETVKELSGTEDKKIAGEGSIGAAFGVVYEPLANLSFRGEVGAIPYKKISGSGLGFDLGGSLKAVLSF
jgi:hypothetical protein